jgi:hypothetical protein
MPNAVVGAAASAALPLEEVQFFWGGRNYCWYGNAWNGPGWYWCGYPWRRGYGWGGGSMAGTAATAAAGMVAAATAAGMVAAGIDCFN